MMPDAVSAHGGQALDMAGFKALLLQSCGHKFEHEREQALISAVTTRMAALKITQGDRYHARLLYDTDELRRLIEMLTVNETYFFREAEHLELLVDVLLPRILARTGQRPVHILSAGCSTGEEPYSVAMLLRERYGDDCEHLFSIIGVDIDSTVIAAAQQGVYGDSSFRGIHQALVQHFVKPCGTGKFRLSDSIKRQVRFEVVNLLDVAHLKGMPPPDIILYRNVSIYFPGSVQENIFRHLADMLAAGGYLLVSATETIHHDLSILSLVQNAALFYYQKLSGTVPKYRRPSAAASSPEREPYVAPAPSANPLSANPPSSIRSPVTKGLSIQDRYDTACADARARRFDDAFATLEVLLAQNAAYTPAYALRANLLLNLSRIEETASVCRQALQQDVLCPQIYLMLGLVARQQNCDDEALQRFREALYLDAACWLAHFHCAEIYYGRGDKKRARSSYEAASRALCAVHKTDGKDMDILPLGLSTDSFATICKHKLSLLTGSNAHGL